MVFTSLFFLTFWKSCNSSFQKNYFVSGALAGVFTKYEILVVKLHCGSIPLIHDLRKSQSVLSCFVFVNKKAIDTFFKDFF